MQWKCLLLLCALIVAVQSAAIVKNDIPVKIVYDKEYSHKYYIRNLDEKVHLSPEELRFSELKINNEVEENSNEGAKNVEEKVQLPPEVIEQIPAEESPKLESTYHYALRNHNEKIQLSPEDLQIALKRLPLDNENEDLGSLKSAAPVEVNDNILYEQVKAVLDSGIESLKEKAKDSELTKNLTPEIWKKLDSDAKKFLEKVKTTDSLRQSQGIMQQFQQFANNFVSQFSGQANQNDEGVQPSFPQNVVNFFTNGFQQMQSGLSNLGQGQQSSQAPAGSQSDPDTSTQAPNQNPLQGFVSSVQGAFSQFLNPGQAPAGTQGEESSTPASGPLQSFQNVVSQVGEAFSNLNPFNQQTQKPGAAADTTPTTSGPFQAFQGIASQAGQVFNQFNPFQQSSTKAPEADPTQNPIQSAAEGIGSQISQGISGVSGGNNPASGIAEQISGAVQGNNPFQGIAEQVSGAVSGNNPLQGAAEQVSGAISGGNNPLQGIAEQVGGNNPFQGVVEQVSGAVSGGNNPLQAVAEQVSGAVSGGNNPLQGAAEQVSGAISGGNNPLQGVADQFTGALGGNNNPVQSVVDQLTNPPQKSKEEEKQE